jgi:hypothetical protein
MLKQKSREIRIEVQLHEFLESLQKTLKSKDKKNG